MCILNGNFTKLHQAASNGGDSLEMGFLSHANHLLMVIFLSLVAVSELNNLWNEFCCKFIVSQAGCNFTNSILKLLSKKIIMWMIG